MSFVLAVPVGDRVWIVADHGIVAILFFAGEVIPFLLKNSLLVFS
jgi:hypothetical protein